MTIRQFTSDPVFRQRYWARNHVGWRHMDETLPNAGHRAVAALERNGVVTGVITQNVDLLHTKAGSRDVINLHGTYAQVICLSCGDSMTRAALAEELDALNPGFIERVEAVGGLAVAPDADAVVADTASFRYLDCPSCGGMLKPDIVYFGENVPKAVVEQAFSLIDAADALLVAGSSLTVFSGYRFVRHAAALGIPVAIVNRGPTRGDDLATVKVEGGCSELLTLLSEELAAASSSSLERAGHAANAVDEIARHVYRFARLDVRQLTQQLAEDRAQLRPGHVRAQAEVHPATAEPDVRIGTCGSGPSAPDAQRLRCPSCRTDRTSPPSRPRRMVWPPISKSVAAVRRNVITGVAQRMNSSTAPPMRLSKSSSSQARWSG